MKTLKKTASDINDVITITVTDGMDTWEETLPVYDEDLEDLTLLDVDWEFKNLIQDYSLNELNDLANRIEDLDQDAYYAFITYLDKVEDDIDKAFEIADNQDFVIYDDCYNIADFGGEYWTRNVDDIGINIPELIDVALSNCMDWEKFGNYIERYLSSIEIGVFPCSVRSDMYIEFF